MKWFRLYNDILDDTKITKMSDKTFKIFIFILAFCSELEKNGTISLHDHDPIWRLRLRKNVWEKAIKELIELNILTLQDNVLTILNWDKRQYKSDDINERVKRYRKKNVTLQETLHETAPETETESESETEIENKQFISSSINKILHRNPGNGELKKAVSFQLQNRNVEKTVADTAVDNYGIEFILRKIAEFDYLAIHNKNRIALNPAGYLVKSISDKYGPPEGFEQWHPEYIKRILASDKVPQIIKDCL